MISFKGIILTVVITFVLIFASIAGIFSIAQAWMRKQSEVPERIAIACIACVVSIFVVLVFGALAAGVIALLTLATVGYF